jgi:hypothetical protein
LNRWLASGFLTTELLDNRENVNWNEIENHTKLSNCDSSTLSLSRNTDDAESCGSKNERLISAPVFLLKKWTNNHESSYKT